MIHNDTCIEIKNSERSRQFINIVKGLAIFLMLWGHSIQYCAEESFDFFENNVFKIIYSFHMPLFMIVSGYLFFYSFQKRDLKELIIHRSKSLLWPIFIGSIFNCIITSGVLLIYANHSIGQFFNGALFNRFGSLWFLWSVLVSAIGVAVICKKVNKIWLQILLLVVWTIVVYAFPNGHNNLYVYPYFVIGFYFARYKNSGKNYKVLELIIKIISIVLFVVMLFFFEKKHYIYTSNMFGNEYSFVDYVGIDLFRWAIGLVGCISVLSIVEWLFNAITVNSKKQLPLSSGLSKIGEKSLQMYVLSVSLLSFWLPIIYGKIITWVGGNVLAHNMILYNLVYTPLIALAYSFGIYFVIKLFEKIKFSKVLFGK